MSDEKAMLIQFISSAVPLQPSAVREIAAAFGPMNLTKGELLLREHQVSDDYCFLAKGLLRTFVVDLKGNEITTDFFTENQIAFEVTSFFNRVPSVASIQAITDCAGWRISYDKLNTLFHDKPAFRDFGRAILVKKFIAAQKRNYGMIIQTAEQRYQNLLNTQPQILQYAPLKYIASYLGITDSTLSRLRRKL